jgi:hypothetical protein
VIVENFRGFRIHGTFEAQGGESQNHQSKDLPQRAQSFTEAGKENLKWMTGRIGPDGGIQRPHRRGAEDAEKR